MTYRARSAVREVGKVFGLSQDAIGMLPGTIWGWDEAAVDETGATRAGLWTRTSPASPAFWPSRASWRFSAPPVAAHRRFRHHALPASTRWCRSPTPRCRIAPSIEWDKDDLDALGILKVDVLALGMLSCDPQGGFDLLAKHKGIAETLASIPQEDPEGRLRR